MTEPQTEHATSARARLMTMLILNGLPSDLQAEASDRIADVEAEAIAIGAREEQEKWTPYVVHRLNCGGPVYDCTCGLDALLAEPEAGS